MAREETGPVHWPSFGVACAAIAAIMLGLIFRGGLGAGLAALIGSAMCAIAAVAVMTSRPGAARQFVRANGVSIIALALLVLYVVATAGLLGAALPPHPLWGNADTYAASAAPFRAVEGLAALCAPLAAFAIGSVSVQTRDDRDRIAKLILGGALAFSVYALFTHASTGGVGGRLSVHFGSANSAATAFAIVSLISAAGAIRAVRRSRTHHRSVMRILAVAYEAPLAVSAFVLSLACLLLTASRGGQLAAAIGLSVLLAVHLLPKRSTNNSERRGAGLSVRTAVSGLALVLAGLMFVGGDYALRRFDQTAEDVIVREVLITEHAEAFVERKLIGHGLNAFTEVNAMIGTPENWLALSNVGSTHNIFVQALEELGLVGALLLAMVFAPALIRLAILAFSRRSGFEWAAGALAAALACLLHGLVDFGLQNPAIAALLAFCVGAFGIGVEPPSKRSTPRRRSARGPTVTT